MQRIESAICIWDRSTPRERMGGPSQMTLLRSRQLTLFGVRGVMVNLDRRALALLQGEPRMIDAALDLLARSRVSPPPSIPWRSQAPARVLPDRGLVIPRLHGREAVWLNDILDAEPLDTRGVVACLAWAANRAVSDSMLGLGTAEVEAHDVFPSSVSSSLH